MCWKGGEDQVVPWKKRRLESDEKEGVKRRYKDAMLIVLKRRMRKKGEMLPLVRRQVEMAVVVGIPHVLFDKRHELLLSTMLDNVDKILVLC